ncbi:MAG: IgGFc-binding protein, partial [Deltaproteobacteria bacterium]|nr:IgGFc-binding protein [Deltaproteobacteria bacterium]
MCLVGFVAVVVAIGACSAGGDDSGGTGGSSSTSSGTGSGTGGSGGIGFGGGIHFGGMGGGCEITCSANLKEVIGCNGEILETCSGDQACLNGECTNDPCGAAQESKSSYGCDFWTMKVDLISAIDGACFVAFVANTWSVPVHIDVDYQGQPITGTDFIRIPQGQGQALTYGAYDPNVGLPVGEVAMLFLAEAPGGYMPDCPVAAAIGAEVGLIGAGFGTAIHFTTDRPVVAYQIIPYGGGSAAATSATLLLPTSAWDTNYVAVNAYAKSLAVPQGQPSLNILAHVDGTEVTILPKVAITGGGGVPPSAANTPVTYNLDRGQYVQLSQDQELTGSPIQSNHPIGLWGGASCLNVPVSETACDGAHQQIPPVKALGAEYVGVRYRNRAAASSEETPPWRVVGAVDGTTLTWTPAPPAGAPTAVNLGDVVEFNASGPFVVASQDADHPFYLAA